MPVLNTATAAVPSGAVNPPIGGVGGYADPRAILAAKLALQNRGLGSPGGATDPVGANNLPPDLLNTRLSQALGGLGQTAQMLSLASKIVPGRQAKNMLSLMAMTAAAASSTNDPSTLMQSVQGPMSDIAMNMMDEKQKRLSQVMRARGNYPMMNPTGAPAPSPMAGLPGRP